MLGHIDSITTALSRIQILAEELRPHIKDVNEEDLASALEREMQHTAELIARAEAKFKVDNHIHNTFGLKRLYDNEFFY